MWISFLIATTLVANALASCPEGWTLYPAGQKCLKVYSARHEYRSFPDARQRCQGHGGDLVQVKDSATSDFIGGITHHWYWMGAWDEHHNRQWSYVDGTPVDSYHPWRRGEPNNSGNHEFCVLVIGSSNRDLQGQWNDGTCADRLPFICELPSEESPCEEGWTYYPAENTCLKTSDSSASYDDARKICQDHGGDLVQNKDSAKTEFVGSLFSHWYWMGVWDKHHNQQFEYLDGTPLGSYKPWRNGEPNNSGNHEFCVLVVGTSNANKGQWNDGFCKDDLHYVCEKPSSIRCDAGWTYYPAENTCLKTSDSSAFYDDARKICQDQGGDLVQNKDSAKTEFVGSLTSHWYWMGVWDKHHNQQFEYVDGTPLGSYKPWRRGEPNNSGGEFCVLVVGTRNANKGQWNDGACGDDLFFVCEKPSNLQKEPTPRSCPEGYHHFEGDNSCVKAYPRSISKGFGDARAFCRANGGGDIVQVRDAEKSQFVGTLMSRTYWMGVHDPRRNRQWVYLDGTPLADYHPWNRGEPNNSRRREFCVMVLGAAGKWNDGYCLDRLGVVCEIA